MNKKKIAVMVVSLAAVSIIGRLIPHLQNATPVTAIALFISAYLGLAYSIPAVLLVMLVSDAFIGFYSLPVMASVYGSFMLASVIGTLLRKRRTAVTVLSASLASSVLFFLITNWAVWQWGGMYDHTLAGLMQSYFLAIPFFRNSIVGDLVYTGMFFGAFELLAKRVKLEHERKSAAQTVV